MSRPLARTASRTVASPAAESTVVAETNGGADGSGAPGQGSGGRYVYRCQLRWADFDAFRHVNNVRYLELFQDARIDFANAMLPDPQRLEAATVVARQEVDYLVPLHYRPGTVDVPIWVTRLGRSSATVAFEITDDAGGETGLQRAGAQPGDNGHLGAGVVYARGSCVVVGYDVAASTSRRFSAAEREVFAAIADPPLDEPTG